MAMSDALRRTWARAIIQRWMDNVGTVQQLIPGINRSAEDVKEIMRECTVIPYYDQYENRRPAMNAEIYAIYPDLNPNPPVVVPEEPEPENPPSEEPETTTPEESVEGSPTSPDTLPTEDSSDTQELSTDTTT